MGRAAAERGVIVWGAPFWLLAGALAAGVPLALHLIRRRPPERSPLPTVRFLSPDPRTSIRVSRPTDWLLLALRMALLLLFGAALARPAWLPAPEGTSELVLLDAGAPLPSAAWRDAVGEARSRLLSPEGDPRGSLILFDTAARRVDRGGIDAALFDSLANAGPSGAGSRYAVALRAIPDAARELRGADSLRATLISPLRWSGWEAGVAPLRSRVWPGALALVDLPPLGRDTDGATAAVSRLESDNFPGDPSAPAAASGIAPAPDASGNEPSAGDGRIPLINGGSDAAARTAVIVATEGGGRFAEAALAATGRDARVVTPGVVPTDAALYLVLAAVDDATASTLRASMRRGATVIATGAGAIGALAEDAPTVAAAAGATGAASVRFEGGTLIEGVSERLVLTAREGGIVIGAWADGRAAAVARAAGEGCAVAFGGAGEGGSIAYTATYPLMLERLARGCEDAAPERGDAPLDAGARAVLRGEGADAVSAHVAEGAGGGAPLGRWLIAAALLVALAETWLAYFRRIA